MNTKREEARRGTQFVTIRLLTDCWKTFPAKITKKMSTRNSSILMMSSSEYLILELECSFTKYVSLCLNTKYLYLRFLKMKAFRINTSESVFQYVMRYGCIKRAKIERLDACYMVES